MSPMIHLTARRSGKAFMQKVWLESLLKKGRTVHIANAAGIETHRRVRHLTVITSKPWP
jgi:hypothetical protein